MNEPAPESPVADNGNEMTTEELDAIAAVVRVLTVDDSRARRGPTTIDARED